MGAPGVSRPLAPKGGISYGTLAGVLIVMGGLTFAGVCQRGELAMCPTWSLRQPPLAAAAAAAGSCASAPKILGERQPFLPADALQRGTANFGSGARFEALGHKLLAGRPITVAFLGGSITWGRGGYEGGSFVNRFTRWLNATFPHPEHRIINQGLPAVTSALFAACFHNVPEESDLVILDFAVNDGHVTPLWRDKNGYSFTDGARKGFEQLMRKSLKLKAQPAVALLNFFSWNATRDKIKDEQGLDVPVGPSFFWRTIEDDLTTIAEYYDAPSLSLRNAVYHLIREGRRGFQWNVSIHHAVDTASEELRDTQFFWDENHPWDRTGHRALAELLMAAVSRGVQTAADARLLRLVAQQQQARGRRAAAASSAAAALPRARVLAAPPLPPPMVTDNYEANATSCHLQEEFKVVIGDMDGFKYEPRAPEEDSFIAQKWGLTARQPGAVATLEVDTGLGGLAGKVDTVQVHLLYLRSWRGMGRAEVACLEGCRCNATQLDAHWEREATLTDLTTLQVSPHKDCVLQLAVLNATSSQDHLFSVSGVVVSNVAARMERGKIGQWEYDKQGKDQR